MVEWRLGLIGVLMALLPSGCTLVFEEAAPPEITFDAGLPDALCYNELFECPGNGLGYTWHSYPGSCSCYASTETFRNAYEGEQECGRNQFGEYRPHLLVIDDAVELAILDDNSKLTDAVGGSPGSLLLGLFYKAETDDWRWATGEKLDLAVYATGLDLLVEDDEFCAHSARGMPGKWVSWPCDMQMGSIETICELDGKVATVGPDPR